VNCCARGDLGFVSSTVQVHGRLDYDDMMSSLPSADVDCGIKTQKLSYRKFYTIVVEVAVVYSDKAIQFNGGWLVVGLERNAYIEE
jgi:hypothetical protein